MIPVQVLPDPGPEPVSSGTSVSRRRDVTLQKHLCTTADPHVIKLMASVDNKTEAEDLPLAPWS
jgi:hypothetical protein